jgi:hypothetical protein
MRAIPSVLCVVGYGKKASSGALRECWFDVVAERSTELRVKRGSRITREGAPTGLTRIKIVAAQRAASRGVSGDKFGIRTV